MKSNRFPFEKNIIFLFSLVKWQCDYINGMFYVHSLVSFSLSVGWLVGQLVNIMAIYLSMKLLKNYHHYHHHNIVTNHIAFVNSQFIQFNNLIHLDFCKSFILFLPPKKNNLISFVCLDIMRISLYYEE